jgi:uncharacterized protein (TIGR02646 family)
LRKLDRTAQPVCLRENAPVWTEEFVTARQQNPAHKFRWRSDVCYGEIRQQLRGMTQGHCAFCDGPVGTESRETVEHFRPKSHFPKLAYQWENLFPCCDVCQSNKLERFDEGLLKPDASDYGFNRYFVVNYQTGELEPAPYASEEEQRNAQTTLVLYGLNTPARKQARKREWEFFSQMGDAANLDDFHYRFFLE